MTKHKIEMQIIYDGRKVQVWEFVSQGLNIGKWSTGKYCDGIAVVKNVKTIMCQEGGTLPLTTLYVVGSVVPPDTGGSTGSDCKLAAHFRSPGSPGWKNFACRIHRCCCCAGC